MARPPQSHQQSHRQLQACETALAPADVLDAAARFFARAGGVYTAFPERRGPTHVVLRGQGGEEIAIAATPVAGGSAVTGSSYLFDQQVARFLSSLPPLVAPPPAPPVEAHPVPGEADTDGPGDAPAGAA